MRLSLGFMAIACGVYGGFALILENIHIMKIPLWACISLGAIVGGIAAGLAWSQVANSPPDHPKQYTGSLVPSKQTTRSNKDAIMPELEFGDSGAGFASLDPRGGRDSNPRQKD